jgi:uncharacterized protein
MLFFFTLVAAPLGSAQVEPQHESSPAQKRVQAPVAPAPKEPSDTDPAPPAGQISADSTNDLAPINVQAKRITADDASNVKALEKSDTVDDAPPDQALLPQPKATRKKATAKSVDNAEAALEILGTSIAPGESRRLLWVAGETSYGSKLETPVYVIRGKRPGLTLCLTAAIHGDELNGVEIIRQLVSELSPKKLYGTVIGVPIVNLLGFTRGTRYLPDRRDLNRYFPGNPNGSSASRIAFSFFENIVRHCDLLIDLHTGSLSRTNMPQVRANLQIPEVLELTTKFGSTAVLHSRKLRGNLRSAATNYGIPAVALELGEPGTLQPEHVEEGVEIIETVLSALRMTRRLWTVGESQPVFYSSRWVRVNTGGLLISKVDVGERIWAGDVLGSMVNPITNESFDVVSPYSGRVLGMALNQFMLPGYAAFNVGIVADRKEAVDDAQSFECIDTSMDPEQVIEEFGCAAEGDEGAEREDMDIDELELDVDIDIDIDIDESEEGN